MLVTGVGPAEEAPNVAWGLAHLIAGEARAVLVEVNDQEAVSPVDLALGLTDLVAGEASFADVIARVPGSHLDRIPAGTLLSDALTGQPEAARTALTALAQAYDWVIVELTSDTKGALRELLRRRATWL